MKQHHRYRQVRNGRRCIIVCDTSVYPYRTLCVCEGWGARDAADEVTDALNERHDRFMGVLRGNE